VFCLRGFLVQDFDDFDNFASFALLVPEPSDSPGFVALLLSVLEVLELLGCCSTFLLRQRLGQLLQVVLAPMGCVLPALFNSFVGLVAAGLGFLQRDLECIGVSDLDHQTADLPAAGTDSLELFYNQGPELALIKKVLEFG